MEKADDFGLLHDATSHWVKELNTVFIRAVSDEGKIYKVPFSMKRVPGSFTGEALSKELLSEISSIKRLKENASESIENAICKYKKIQTKPEIEYKKLHNQLKVCFWLIEFSLLNDVYLLNSINQFDY